MVAVTGDGDTQAIPPLRTSWAGAGVTMARLEDQPGWYGLVAGRVRLWFRGLKLAELAVAASLPVVTGVLNAGVVLFQCHERWIGDRPAAEALRRERHLYQARAGACQAEDREELLAERVEELQTRESADRAGSEQAPGAPR
jgi:hypothetical protein